MANLKTRKTAQGTYSWKIVGEDGRSYTGWTATQAVTPWGARIQARPLLEAANAGEALRASGKAEAFGRDLKRRVRRLRNG